MRTELAHLWDELKDIAKRRDKEFDPATHIAVCRVCGMPSGQLGIVHWPDCDSLDDSDIIFRKLTK